MKANTLAKLPLSLRTFAKLREGSFAYVDKTTLLIRSIFSADKALKNMSKTDSGYIQLTMLS